MINARVKAILNGHDAGAFELPQQILDERAAYNRVEECLRQVREGDPGDPEGVVIDTALELARGELRAADLLKSAGKVSAQAAGRALAVRALARVQETAGEALTAAATWAGESLIAALKDALADTLEQARGASATLRGVLPTPDVVGAGLVSEEIRSAYGVLVAQSARLGQIRTARFQLSLLGIQSQRDEGNIFLEFKNFDELWPSFRKGGDPPWPSDPLSRLLWIMSGPAEAWIPTPLEQDARWLEYVEAVKVRQRRVRQSSLGTDLVP